MRPSCEPSFSPHTETYIRSLLKLYALLINIWHSFASTLLSYFRWATSVGSTRVHKPVIVPSLFRDCSDIDVSDVGK